MILVGWGLNTACEIRVSAASALPPWACCDGVPRALPHPILPHASHTHICTHTQAVKLAFEGGKETLVPVKEVSKEESIAYMSNLYERCQETRAKTKQSLEEKWLQPLIKPKTAAK